MQVDTVKDTTVSDKTIAEKTISAKKRSPKKILRRILIFTGIFLLVITAVVILLLDHLRNNYTGLKRIDREGKMYYVEYTGELTSLTQYSVIYHNEDPGFDVWVYPDYSVSYHFDL